MPKGQTNSVERSNALRLSWKRTVRRAGIENLHFHDLRHEAISRFFERGFACLVRDFYPDTAFALIGVIAIGAAVEGFRQKRKADYIEKRFFEQDYD